ncbi:hypothetical protein ABL78_3843 [Leptomonas seymouri]|uniref:Uncharacterized protein n=1 Tax=Leptomonas seymouri TaxID=5684 RepID=A0A0N1HXD6_LEPSE|nr:hypothetical protein ABL78_3843 [Leptomonas seymouri]|eukprot:KPI87081.1 hypothetical protein ABL78_3843 [Leptomonas seymouri]
MADVMSRIPVSEMKEAHIPNSEQSESTAVKDPCRRCPVRASCTNFGALYDLLHVAKRGGRRGPHPPASIEAVFAHLCTLTPLFLQLDTSTEHPALLTAYCSEVTEGKSGSGSIAANVYMQRVLRQVCVAWQPWVTSAQKERLIADLTCCPSSLYGAAALQEATRLLSPSAAPGGGGVGGSNGTSNSFPVVPQKMHEAEHERSWRALLESVPTFYVSAELVREDVLRRYPLEGMRLWNSWMRAALATAEGTIDEHSDGFDGLGPNRRKASAGEASHDDPRLEVTVDGCAVRLPSKERCLQCGCPARLLYSSQRSTQVLPFERYSLVRSVIYGAQLMHYATSLLATTVTTTAASLDDVRHLFKMQQCKANYDEQQQQPEFTVGTVGESKAHNSRLPAACAAFFPCVEVLLDHPDLAFALEIRDAARGLDCAGLPPLPPRQGLPPHYGSDDALQIQLHPAFSHELRGVADVALSTERRTKRLCDAAATCAPRVSGHASSTASYRLPTSVLVHHVRASADAVPPSLQTFPLCTMPAAGSNSATATEEETVSLRQGVVCLAVVEGGEGSSQPTGGTEQVLLLAFTCDPTTVDIVAVSEPCISMLTARLSGGTLTDHGDASSVPPASEEKSSEAACAADALARLLCLDSVTKVLPSSFYSNAWCNGRPRLFNAVQSLVSVSCSLQHVACYAGLPMGTVVEGAEGDLLLAAMINQRHDVYLELPSDLIQQGLQEGTERGFLRKALHDAASLAVATLLTFRDRQAEEEMLRRFCVGLPSSDSLSVQTQRNFSFTELMKVWATSTHAMHDYSVAMRLSRYMHWLNNLTSTRSCSLLESDVASNTLVSDASLSPAAAREALRELIATYGPDPLPRIQWRDALLSETTSREPAGVSALEKTALPAAANAPDVPDTETDALSPADECDPPQLTEYEELDSIDATLYDALLQDAAAVKQRVTASLPPPSAEDTGALAATAEVESPLRASDTHNRVSTSASTSALPPPGSDPTARALHDQDTLQFYLSTVLGGDAAAPAPGLTQQAPPAAAEEEGNPGASTLPPSMDVANAGQTYASSYSATPSSTIAAAAITTPTEPPRLPRRFVLGPRSSCQQPCKSIAASASATTECTPMPQRLLPGFPIHSSSSQGCPPGLGRHFGSDSASSALFAFPLQSYASFRSSNTPARSPAAPPVGDISTAARLAPAGAGSDHDGATVFVADVSSPSPLPTPTLAATPSSTATPTVPTECATDVQTNVFASVSDAERLRLATLLVDILRGHPDPPSTPPHR